MNEGQVSVKGYFPLSYLDAIKFVLLLFLLLFHYICISVVWMKSFVIMFLLLPLAQYLLCCYWLRSESVANFMVKKWRCDCGTSYTQEMCVNKVKSNEFRWVNWITVLMGVVVQRNIRKNSHASAFWQVVGMQPCS